MKVSKIIWKGYKRITGNGIWGKEYTSWMKEKEKKEKAFGQYLDTFVYEPKYSIVIPLYQTPLSYLQELVASIEIQEYGKWELCLSEGSGRPEKELRSYLDHLAAQDDRIHVIYSQKPLNISENTNAALRMAGGDFIVFADHDDLLTEDALWECTKALNQNPAIDLMYSDEDKVEMNQEKYFHPHFKPDFNLELLRSMNYFCHLVVVSRKLQEKAGLLRKEFDGAQDYDFVLRCVELAESVHHIPKVLYHWRAHEGSLAGNTGSKEYAKLAGRNALRQHLQRCGVEASVQETDIFGVYRICYRWPDKEKLTVIVAGDGNEEHLKRCISMIRKELGKWTEQILVVDSGNETGQEETFTRISCRAESGLIEKYRIGMERAETEYGICVQSEVDFTGENLIQLAAVCRQTKAAVCGGIVEDGKRTLHAGSLVTESGKLVYPFRNEPIEEPGYFARKYCTQEVFGVETVCMGAALRKFPKTGRCQELTREADEETDFFCELAKRHERVVLNADVKLCVTKKQKWFYVEELSPADKKYAKTYSRFYNVNLSADKPYTLRPHA